MLKSNKYIIIFFSLIVITIVFWYFSTLIYYTLFAIVLSFIGQPLTTIIGKIKIRGGKLPRSISALISLLIICTVIVILISIFIPIIVSQASAFANIDVGKLSGYINNLVKPIEDNLRLYNFIGKNDSIINILSLKILNILKVVDYSLIINYIFTFTGNIIISVFAVLFITYFILKDEHLVYKAIILLTPSKFQEEMNNILSASKKLLTRYFLG